MSGTWGRAMVGAASGRVALSSRATKLVAGRTVDWAMMGPASGRVTPMKSQSMSGTLMVGAASGRVALSSRWATKLVVGTIVGWVMMGALGTVALTKNQSMSGTLGRAMVGAASGSVALNSTKTDSMASVGAMASIPAMGGVTLGPMMTPRPGGA